MKAEDFYELRYLAQLDSKQRTMTHSMCEGKRGYPTKADAERTIRKGKPISAFRCLVCRQWHLGTITTSREARLVKQRRLERAYRDHPSAWRLAADST